MPEGEKVGPTQRTTTYNNTYRTSPPTNDDDRDGDSHRQAARGLARPDEPLHRPHIAAALQQQQQRKKLTAGGMGRVFETSTRAGERYYLHQLSGVSMFEFPRQLAAGWTWGKAQSSGDTYYVCEKGARKGERTFEHPGFENRKDERSYCTCCAGCDCGC